jgi:hypothetical protein
MQSDCYAYAKVPNNIVVVTESNLDHTFFKEQDLTLISLESWNKLILIPLGLMNYHLF